MATKRSSGLDFSDKLDALAAHPDVLQRAPNATNLQRNKTERHRLQGIMRNVSNNDENPFRVGSGSNGAAGAASAGGKLMNKLKDEKLMDRWHTWLINGGRSKILLGVYVLLHLVVITMGFLQYQLKDNNSIARSEVGLGFGESFRPLGPVVAGRRSRSRW
jgi:NADPH oxidase 2